MSGPETPFERSRYLRYVPPVESEAGATRRHWIIVHEPHRVPEKKGPFKEAQVTPFLNELVECRSSDTQFTVVSLTWDFDVWIEDGRGRLAEQAIWDRLDVEDFAPQYGADA